MLFRSGRTQLLDVDSEESYQLMAHCLEDSLPTGRWLLALSLGIPSLGAVLLVVLGGTPSGLRPADAWSKLLECGLTPRQVVVAHVGGSLFVGALGGLDG